MTADVISRLSKLTDTAIEQAGGQQALSRDSGLSQGTISRWKSKSNSEWPQIGHLILLAKFLGWKLGELTEHLHSGEEPEFVSVDELLRLIHSQQSVSYEDAVRLYQAVSRISMEGNHSSVL